MTEGDILRELTDAEFLELLAVSRKHFPYTLRAHHFLLVHYRLKVTGHRRFICDDTSYISPRFRCKFFTHKNGDIKNCTFIATSDEIDNKHSEGYAIFIFSLNNIELKECLMKTNRIDWHNDPLFTSTQSSNYRILDEVAKGKKFKLHAIFENTCYWLPKEKARSFNDSNLPLNLMVGPLRSCDADTINDEWPHKEKGTDSFMRTQIVLNGGWGLYERDTNQILSWAIKNDNFACGSLQTLKSEKRKGYGELILKEYCKKFANEENLDVIAFVMTANKESQNLFRKLGFLVYDVCCWSKAIKSAE